MVPQVCFGYVRRIFGGGDECQTLGLENSVCPVEIATQMSVGTLYIFVKKRIFFVTFLSRSNTSTH